MSGVPLGNRTNQLGPPQAIDAAVRAIMLPRTGRNPDAIQINRQALRVCDGKPGRWRGRCGGEANRNAVLREERDDPVQPPEIITITLRFELGPRKDPEADEIDTR